MRKVNCLSFIVENAEFTIFIQRDKFIAENELLSPPHIHALSEIHMILDGSVVMEGDFGEVEIQKHQVCVVPPLTYHSTVSVSENANDRIDMSFMIKKLSKVDYTVDIYKMLERLFVIDSLFIKLNVDPMLSDEIKKAVNLCDGVFARMTPMQKIKIKNIFSLFFISMAEQLEKKSDKKPENVKIYTSDYQYYSRIICAERCFNGYTDNKISFKEISDEIHLCEKQLSNIIKKEYNRTLKTMIFERKMKKAAQLMRFYESMPICEVAERVGYASADTLSVMFKKYYGISATEYRELNRKEIMR